MRTQKMLAQLLVTPYEQWKQLRLTNVARRHHTPQVLEQTIHYPEPLSREPPSIDHYRTGT